MKSKEEIYNEATLRSLGSNANGTRMDIIYDAMERYAIEYHSNIVRKDTLNKGVRIIDPNIRYKCLLCGRKKFDRPQAHICGGGYRKRGLKWDKIFIENIVKMVREEKS